MNPIGTIAHAIAHPVRSAGSVAGRALGLAATGARVSARVINWGAHRLDADHGPYHRADPLLDHTTDTSPAESPAVDNAASEPSTRKTRTARARKAPSAKAATAGPAVAEAAREDGDDPGRAVAAAARDTTEEPGDDAAPLLDPSVAKAVRSESETLRRAADPMTD